MNWLVIYKRSQMTNASSEPRPSKAKVQIRELSPYNLFCRDIFKNKGTMNDIKGRCSTLGEDAKQKHIQEAAALREHGQEQDLNPEMEAICAVSAASILMMRRRMQERSGVHGLSAQCANHGHTQHVA